MSNNSNSPAILIHWPRLGPYHVARVRAATRNFSEQGLRLIALELFGAEDEYLWERVGQGSGTEIHTLFPSTPVGRVSKMELFRAIWKHLDRLRPQAVVINGYSSWDSWVLLAWCKMKGAFPILMSDSRWDDAPRTALGEWVKRILVQQYGAALCAGAPQRKYLESLGMPPDRIFDGYDAVDNQFFGDESDKARQSPERYQTLPGLADPRSYFLASGRFIPRKNFSGLLEAYALYRERCRKGEHDTWRLVLLGDGPQRASLLNTIQALDLQEDVVLAGVQNIQNLPAYYGLASAFIHPALQDQWGLVVNEAMASGLPVLVSKQAGCAVDLVADGVEGFAFSPEDTAGLAHLMSLMSSGQVDRDQMGSAARRKISYWGVERFSQGLYQALCVGMDG